MAWRGEPWLEEGLAVPSPYAAPEIGDGIIRDLLEGWTNPLEGPGAQPHPGPRATKAVPRGAGGWDYTLKYSAEWLMGMGMGLSSTVLAGCALQIETSQWARLAPPLRIRITQYSTRKRRSVTNMTGGGGCRYLFYFFSQCRHHKTRFF